jgi:hypothetical protein
VGNCRGTTTAIDIKDLGDGPLELGPDRTVDEKVTRSINDQKTVVERCETQKPDWGSKI